MPQRSMIVPNTPQALGARIKAAAEQVGGLDRLAELIPEMSRRSLSDYVNAKSEPRAALIARIAEKAGVSAGWLLAGEGPMLGGPLVPKQPMGNSIDLDRLELAIATIERGLAEAGRVASPSVKAQLTIAAYELLGDRSERSVTSVLRLVKG